MGLISQAEGAERILLGEKRSVNAGDIQLNTIFFLSIHDQSAGKAIQMLLIAHLPIDRRAVFKKLLSQQWTHSGSGIRVRSHAFIKGFKIYNKCNRIHWSGTRLQESEDTLHTIWCMLKGPFIWSFSLRCLMFYMYNYSVYNWTTKVRSGRTEVHGINRK